MRYLLSVIFPYITECFLWVYHRSGPALPYRRTGHPRYAHHSFVRSGPLGSLTPVLSRFAHAANARCKNGSTAGLSYMVNNRRQTF